MLSTDGYLQCITGILAWYLEDGYALPFLTGHMPHVMKRTHAVMPMGQG